MTLDEYLALMNYSLPVQAAFRQWLADRANELRTEAKWDALMWEWIESSEA